MLTVKRVYEPAKTADGRRVLVDRLWPRGLSKEKAKIHEWAKEIAPSDALRKWYGHDPEKWPDFRRRYLRELRANAAALTALRRASRGKGRVTLLFAAADAARNNAVVLLAFLKTARSRPRKRGA